MPGCTECVRCAGEHQSKLTEDDVPVDGADAGELRGSVVADGTED